MELPELLDAACAPKIAAWRETEASHVMSATTRAAMPRVFACSDYVANQCLREPGLLSDLDASGRLGRHESAAVLQAAVSEALSQAAESAEDAQMRALRRVRHRELVRIAWRDLAGWARIGETLADLSALADALIGVAAVWAQSAVEGRFGVVRSADGRIQRLIVVAMGKLGGRELNFSSDVDLVLLYPHSGHSDGERQLDGDRYFARIGRQLIRLLERPTGDGFVYRVDTRLRPFGNSGALVASYAAFETYLQQHGREWERYAYVKARPVTGSDAERQEFAELVRPFVYRRYLDYGVLESLREMKALIAADVARRSRRHDLKLGPGGIREVEFIVQTFQMLRGGSNPALRNPSLLEVLPELARRQWLDEAAARDLESAYGLLRRAENHLQAWRDEQTHVLPDGDEGRARLACSLGFADWPACDAAIGEARDCVSANFRATIAGDHDDDNDERPDILEAIWRDDPGASTASAAFAALGFADPGELQRALGALRASSQYRHLDQRGRDRLDMLIPRIVRIAASQAEADRVVARLLRIVTAVGRRSAYFALLNENPAVLERLADLAAASSWIARRVAERPILLDELIDPRLFEMPPTREDFCTELEQRFAGIAEGDLERQMEALREFKQAAVFRVAAADLSGVLPLMKVSDRLTDIAELVLERVIELAWHDTAGRYGRPRCGEPGELRAAGFAIIGYGKLGGLELGYASDLDIVLMHDSGGSVQQTDAQSPLDNARFFSRLGQRILHMLATTTLSGVLYEVDTRLRPSGKAGPLVSSIEAFEKYQHSSAWTWEHQALLRARGVAGDADVIRAFEAVRIDVLTQPQDADELRAQVAGMRERMRHELPGGGPGHFDIKRDPGGLTDIEFLVQYLVLAHAAAQPALVRYSDNIRQLEALAAGGVLGAGDSTELADIYRRFRQRLHRLALADRPGRVAQGEFAAERRAVEAHWRVVFGD